MHCYSSPLIKIQEGKKIKHLEEKDMLWWTEKDSEKVKISKWTLTLEHV